MSVVSQHDASLCPLNSVTRVCSTRWLSVVCFCFHLSCSRVRELWSCRAREGPDEDLFFGMSSCLSTYLLLYTCTLRRCDFRRHFLFPRASEKPLLLPFGFVQHRLECAVRVGSSTWQGGVSVPVPVRVLAFGANSLVLTGTPWHAS